MAVVVAVAAAAAAAVAAGPPPPRSAPLLLRSSRVVGCIVASLYTLSVVASAAAAATLSMASLRLFTASPSMPPVKVLMFSSDGDVACRAVTVAGDEDTGIDGVGVDASTSDEAMVPFLFFFFFFHRAHE